MGKVRTYRGTSIEIDFDMARCIHARNCFLKLPQVFDPSRKPWVAPDAAPAEEVAAMIRTCPSGALTFRRLDGGQEEAPTPINRVAVLENGPIALQGDLDVEGERMTRATLCRCGKSGNKPFCDYAHVDAGFEATGEPSSDAAKDKDLPAGALKVARIPDGPLKMEGPVEVTTGTGHRLARMERAFLCRCGASKNKPFCDGSHKEIGFSDPA
ncbi:CDGSH iron-sulfur domain-containing protein [Pseudaestuariivita atlantica]|uniref:Iron-binding protein n=1 Tax=Pseudaestuariivita atlantica TaxID=1317121 RepID=A0A0L1JTQ3_9RHOB|nr:CDGSH iron-sulfur domain-containing protein [Pseudaestuariivita atlantica]KNG94793.1 iron-binding protein [Pseudaestuariivita atlantica]